MKHRALMHIRQLKNIIKFLSMSLSGVQFAVAGLERAFDVVMQPARQSRAGVAYSCTKYNAV
jgi:hypothetical protein